MKPPRTTPHATLAARRRSLGLQHGCRFVDPTRFVTLLVARRRFERFDDAGARALGLRDPLSGERYLVEEELLERELA